MPQPHPDNDRLDRLRQWRNAPPRDLSLAFLKQQFKQQIERPYRQLGPIVTAWEKLVPAELTAHSRLQSLRRGVLKVTVDSSEHLYELDRLLRTGLEAQLIRTHGAGLRKVQLVVGNDE